MQYKSPCYQCPKRVPVPDCHITCPDYNTWTVERAEKRKAYLDSVAGLRSVDAARQDKVYKCFNGNSRLKEKAKYYGT